MDLIGLGSRLQRIESDIESLRKAEEAPSKFEEILDRASKLPFIGPIGAWICSYIISPATVAIILVTIISLWILITLLGITSAVNWAHKNLFGTHEAISAEYSQQRDLYDLGREENASAEGLYKLISEDIDDVLRTRRQLISSISSGTFVFTNNGGQPDWLEDSIPIYFSTSVNEAAWFYVRISIPGNELKYFSLGSKNSMDVSEMFEFRGTPYEDQSENSHKLNTFSEKGGFYEQKLTPASLVPSLGQPFHKFDLTISLVGKTFLEKYVENQQVTSGLYLDGYRLRADIMVVVKPK